MKMSEFAAAKKALKVGNLEGVYFDINTVNDFGDISKLPFTLKILLENLLRHQDHAAVSDANVKSIATWLQRKSSEDEVPFFPSRVLMQDFTGVPAVVDLAAMREGVKALGGDPSVINPLVPVDLVIDHSVMVDYAGTADSFQKNMDLEFERNAERYEFLKWGQETFDNFRVVPPGTGICHQVNVEYLAPVVGTRKVKGEVQFFPDTVFGTDSHTTMVNGLAVLGWGVGGIEAEAAMLGKPTATLIPEVVGFELTGQLVEGATATDLVLTITQILRKKGVVGKFVEFCGEGLATLPAADRLTIANMAPEYGATCGFFPIDEETIKYLQLTARPDDQVALVEAYAKKQGLWRVKGQNPEFTTLLQLNLKDVVPSISGPKRPQDRVELKNADVDFENALKTAFNTPQARTVDVEGHDFSLTTGDVVIAAITSCTNTSNPYVMIAAGLVAQKAAKKGLTVKPWVKTSLAPGSQVVSDYLEKSGLQKPLDQMGFNVVGYGCTTCIGNSGPLDKGITKAIDENNMIVTAVLSGNRNFEGRISPQVQANYLASPPLVVAYAIAGTMRKNLMTEAIDFDPEGNPVFLKEIWPTQKEVSDMVAKVVGPEMFRQRYANVFDGPKEWQDIKVTKTETYSWNNKSTYVQNPPYFEGLTKNMSAIGNIENANVLAVFGDSVTTDHISPAGNIKAASPAGSYLQAQKVAVKDFNSFGSRRGNHEVMMRGTFANIRIKNLMLDGIEGGLTKFVKTGEQMPIYDAAMKYQETKTPLVVIAGKEYGTGSSRDWAAKGTALLGVRAVIAESFERIHRANLAGMGVLPLQFMDGVNKQTLKITGLETFSIKGLSNLNPRQEFVVEMKRPDGSVETFKAHSRLDTFDDVENFKNGGILQATIRQLIQ
jgi:aconitate hydratase